MSKYRLKHGLESAAGWFIAMGLPMLAFCAIPGTLSKTISISSAILTTTAIFILNYRDTK